MKRCPTCQKTYADTMKFCQTDGTPLVEDQSATPPADPYKTVVGSIKSDDILQIPESYDPMKTMVTGSAPPKVDPPKPAEPKKEETLKEATSGTSPKVEPSSPPKPVESSLNPPSFGDLSSPAPGSTSSGKTKPRSFDETFSSIEPPAFGSSKGNTAPFNKPSDAPFGSPSKTDAPFGNAPKSDSPFGSSPKSDSPFGSASKDDAPPTAFGGSPFDSPKASTPPPPYKDPEPFNAGGQSPFGQQANDPWATPQQQQSNDPFGSPQFGGQGEWTPPPAPVAGWQDQGLGANTPFQPPMGTGGQNQTLAIVSLVTGILSLCLCGAIAGIPAIITGYMAKNNADTNPAEYGGRGMALAGMILGGISVVFTALYIIFIIISAVSNR